MVRYSRKTVEMQHYPHPEPQNPSTPMKIALSSLAVLALVIIWLALTADRTPSPPPAGRLAPVSTDHANVTEQRLTLTDGRTVLCLSFPGTGHQVSCDWTRAFIT